MSKRSETGKKLGRKWKLKGHAHENLFNASFDKRRDINFSEASSDCEIDDNILREVESLYAGGRKVSLKSGSTAQFHLGNIPELSDKDAFRASLQKKIIRNKPATCGTHNKSWDEQLKVLKNPSFWGKYIGKGDFYVQLEKDHKNYTYFAMKDVIRFVCEKTEWRLLETGRIKGDLPEKTPSGKTKKAAVLTFEYRPEHDSFVLGAHGGENGYRFCEILKQNLDHKTLRE